MGEVISIFLHDQNLMYCAKYNYSLAVACVQTFLELLCACECGSAKNVPIETIEFSRGLDADLDEKCQKIFEACHFVPTSGARCLRRLLSSACERILNKTIYNL